jgi:hypothetical protein
MHTMNVQEVGTAEDANSNPLATAAASSGVGCLVCQQKASVFYRRPTGRSDDDVCTCSTRIFSNHVTQTGTIGVALAGERGGGAHSSCSSSSSNDNDDYDSVLPTSDALHHKLDQLYAPSSSVRTSGGGRRRRGGGTKKKTVDIYLNGINNKGYGSSNSKISSDDSLSMKKPAAIPLGSVKLATKHSGGSSMGSETALSASSAQHLLGFHLKLREPFRAQSLSTLAMQASTTASTTAAASKSDASWTASASAPAVAHCPPPREGPLARSASLRPKPSYSTSWSQMEHYRPEQLQQQDESQDWLNTHPQPSRHSASVSAAKSSDCLVIPPYQKLRLNWLPQKEEQVTEALLGAEKDTYPSAIVHPKPSVPNSKRWAGAIEAVSVAASPPSLPTKSVSLQVLSPISSSKVAHNPYLHLVLDELHIEDGNNRQGYPGHHHPPTSLSQPQPLHPWQSEQPGLTSALSEHPLVTHRPRSICTTTLGATFPTRSQRSPSYAVTMNSSNHHQPSCISESFHSESKRQRERIWQEYLRLIESRSGRDPGRTISSSCSESGTSSNRGGRLFFLEEYPSQEQGYSNKKKNEKTSSKSSSSKADGSDRSSATTTGGNRESFILDKMEQLEWMYDLDQVHGDDNYFDEARPELQ